jgi:hypothetical protein
MGNRIEDFGSMVRERQSNLSDDRELPLHRSPDDAILPLPFQTGPLKHPGDAPPTLW